MTNERSEQFLRLYSDNADSLWRFVRSLVKTDHDAEDVVSETVLQALEGLHRLRDEQAFVSFLFTIASRIVKRQRWRRRIFGSYNEVEVEERSHPDSLPDVQADVVILRQALQQLPPKMQEALVLFEINGLHLDEIQKIQGGSLSGVKSRIARGRQQLAKILEVDDAEEPQRTPPLKKTNSHPIVQQQTVV